MQGYKEIFEKRGKSYNSAMIKYPHARDEEFQAVADSISIGKNCTILDLPAGGGYLQRFLPRNVNYLAYDFSKEFYDDHAGVKKCKESRIDLPDGSVDVIVSLAALHHVTDRSSFYAEMYRLLKPRGQFVLADVVSGSKVDTFLNDFVNRWNSMGHLGKFIEPDLDLKELSKAGLVAEFEEKMLRWNFENEKDAKIFFKDLFYLDRNPSDRILAREQIKLGSTKSNSYKINWSLGFFLGKKPYASHV